LGHGVVFYSNCGHVAYCVVQFVEIHSDRDHDSRYDTIVEFNDSNDEYTA